MFKIIILTIYFCILFSNASFAQFKSLLDSKYKKFNIGFKLEIPANQKIQIAFYNQDSSYNKILLDTNFRTKQKVIFLFSSVKDSEKNNYSKYFIITIPEVNSGIYFIEMNIKEKFFITK